jgi:hypothetical protein
MLSLVVREASQRRCTTRCQLARGGGDLLGTGRKGMAEGVVGQTGLRSGPCEWPIYSE